MKSLNILFFILISAFNLTVEAQNNILDRIKNIKAIASTRDDVEKVLGKGEDRDFRTVFHYDKETVEILYSSGRCTAGWLAPKDTVIEIDITFLDDRKLARLTKKVDLAKLRISNAYDRGGERMYRDDENGVRYYVDVFEKKWESVTFYPSTKYSRIHCEK